MKNSADWAIWMAQSDLHLQSVPFLLTVVEKGLKLSRLKTVQKEITRPCQYRREEHRRDGFEVFSCRIRMDLVTNWMWVRRGQGRTAECEEQMKF